MKKAIRILYLFSAGLLLSAFFAGCSYGGSGKSITISSKTFTENILLAEMYAQLIESHTDVEVVREFGEGNTQTCYTGLKTGEIDIYVDYTGTLYAEVLKLRYDPGVLPEEVYDAVKKEIYDADDITVFSPIGPNNTYALAMLREKADSINVSAISELGAAAPKLVFAGDSIFYARFNDGYDSMVAKYGLQFRSSAMMENDQLYVAAAEGLVDVIVVYATDSELTEYDMVILEDDLQFFPAYYAVPLIRNEPLKKHPELNDVLELLADRISDERMQELNYLVDIEGKELSEVATAFLTEEGLLE